VKIYFDTCSLNRPLDNKAQLRIALEAEAVLGLLAQCDLGTLTLVSSEVLSLELDRNQQAQKKAFVSSILEKAGIVITVNDAIERRGKMLEQRSFKAFDALHIATAEAGAVDYFCTCDDRVLKKARQQADLSVKVISPLELANEVSP
jgi:predicted nucleic acid-binding protein